MKKYLFTAVYIFVGSILYAAATNFFVFSSGLFFGGTSGISVILASFTQISTGTILMAINFVLLVLALLILGKGIAVKTLIGSTATTLFVGILEKICPITEPIISNPYLSGLIGATIIAIASGFLFYADSSSGGTDIIALIVKKYSKLNIGKALLVSDLLIVIIGGLTTDLTIAIASFVGLLVKTLGIDFVIMILKQVRKT